MLFHFQHNYATKSTERPPCVCTTNKPEATIITKMAGDMQCLLLNFIATFRK